MGYLHKANWSAIQSHRNAVFMVNVEGPSGYTHITTVEKNDLLSMKYYITYGSCTIVHEIVDKAMDENNNLILFVKDNVIECSR